MTEPVSLGFAVVSLSFQLFAGCVKGYQLLSDARGMPAKFQFLRVRLKTEQCRLLDWAHVAQLNERNDKLVTGNVNQALLVDVLDQQLRLLTRFGKYDEKLKPLRKPLLSDDAVTVGIDDDDDVDDDGEDLPEHSSKSPSFPIKKGDSFASVQSRFQSRFPQSEELLKKSLALMEKSTLFPARLRWAAWEREKVEELIMKLSALNDYMKELLNTRQLELLLSRQMRTDYQIMQLNNKLDHLVQIFESSKVITNVAVQLHAPTSPSHAYLQARGLEQAVEEIKTQFSSHHLASLAKAKALNSAIDSGALDEKVAKEFQLEYTARDVPPVELDRMHITLVKDDDCLSESHRVEAHYQPPKSEHGQQVWIEWKSYRPTGPNGDPEPKVLERVQALAALLRENNRTDQFRALHCLGFFRDCDVNKDRYRFGLVFERPEGVDPATRPTTLLELLRDPDREMPSLTERIALATATAECLERLHAVNWLHKGLRSHNVIFFESADGGLDLGQPYVSGFDYSRPAQNEDMTERPPKNFADDLYRHPLAQGAVGPRGASFKKSFDIYSLGVILLEIAYWKPLDVILGLDDSKVVKPAESIKVRQRLLEEKTFLGYVKSHLGRTVVGVVEACVEGLPAFGIAEQEDENAEKVGAKLQNEFYVRVVDKLGSIRV